MKILIPIIVVLIVCIFVVIKKKTKISEYDKLLSSIDDMSYDELDKIHQELLPLSNEIAYVMLPLAYDYGEFCYDSPEISAQKLKQKRAETLPKKQQIYGCKTYGDAKDLNQAIVKRMDELYENQKKLYVH